MKSHPFKLSIENPCSQDWNSMTENEQGRFCERCAKSVIDYTGLSDKELIHAISSSSNPICGRLKPQQLNRLIGDEKMISVNSPYKFLTGLFILGASKSAFSADEYQPKPNPVQSFIIEKSILSEENNRNEDTLLQVVEGRIRDGYTSEFIPGAVIKILDSKFVAISDMDGNFKFVLPDTFTLKTITLSAEYFGDKIEDVIIDRTKKASLIEMTTTVNEMDIIGELIISKPKKWWQFWKRR
ncbi:hypothetical protein [Fluviicola taffensis]|uniref:hypothetical protein n=1 Tax=Fluviicola taffensis TaxID=191579 RepID=UPI003137B5DC